MVQLVKRMPADHGHRLFSPGPIRTFAGAGVMIGGLAQTRQAARGFAGDLRQLKGLLKIRFQAEFLDQPVQRCPVQAGERVNLSVVGRYDLERGLALFRRSLVNDFRHCGHSSHPFGPGFPHQDGGNPALFVRRSVRRQRQAQKANCN